MIDQLKLMFEKKMCLILKWLKHLNAVLNPNGHQQGIIGAKVTQIFPNGGLENLHQNILHYIFVHF